MHIDLSESEVKVLLECLSYSKLHVREGSAPPDGRRLKLEQLDAVSAKLKAALNERPKS